MSSDLPVFTLEQVKALGHIVVDGIVYDISRFAAFHPGGESVLVSAKGTDASSLFHLYHNPSVLIKYGDKLRVGALQGYSAPQAKLPGAFGDCIPYADPMWYTRFNSPYYKDTHRAYRHRVRTFVDERIMPTYTQWRSEAEPPRDIYLEMGRHGFLAAMVGPPFPIEYVDPGTPVPEDFDYFHEMILYDEISRCGNAAVNAALTNGPAIAISALWRFGDKKLKDKYLKDVLMGRSFCALAISEPGAGSDVAGLTCSATREGGEWIVTGNKKWITNGIVCMYADIFITAVMTGAPGQNGMSVLLVHKDTPGFSVRKVNIRGADLSGTAYLDFHNARVPLDHLIGPENDGFRIVMYNFNHERFYICAMCVRLSRVCMEECIKYALRRKTFGKALHEHQAIRMKIAAMARRIECLQAWLESLVYQMVTMSHEEASMKIGDVMCLCKAEASKVLELCAREATMIFGGNALMMGGVGDKIECSVAQVKAFQIPAGAEECALHFVAVDCVTQLQEEV